MIDSILGNVFGAAIANHKRIQRLHEIRETRNFQQGSLAGQKKIIDGQNRSIDVQNHWGRIQSNILNKMSSTLDRIDAEMTAVRKLQTESLAIQKELLARDNLQAFLEEFIYQSQKLVAECSSDQSQLPASTRYFLLQGLLAYVKEISVGTPMIRGRENKFAFDSAIEQAKSIKKILGQTDEVKEALIWHKNELKLLAKAKEAEQAKQAKLARQMAIRRLIVSSVIIVVPVIIAFGCAGVCLFSMFFRNS